MSRRGDAMAVRHPSQLLALAIGVIYTLVGVGGFAVTGFDEFASVTGETLLGFEINPLHNLVHLVIGLAGLAMWRRLDSARLYGWLLVVGYGAAFVYGLFAAGNDDINFLSINAADNGLHLVSALAGLAIALWPAGRTVPGRAADRRTSRHARAPAGPTRRPARRSIPSSHVAEDLADDHPRRDYPQPPPTNSAMVISPSPSTLASRASRASPSAPPPPGAQTA